MAPVKLIFWCKVAYLFQSLAIVTILAENPPQQPGGGGGGAQPFLNSLAVLFRSRPPFPTTFPSATNGLYAPQAQQKQNAVAVASAPIPSNMLPGSPKQGILVAHPMNTTPMLTNSINIMNSNNNNNNQNQNPGNVITAIRSPNPHTFPNNQQNNLPPGTISLKQLAPGQSQPPHRPGFIAIAVKGPVGHHLPGQGPPMPPPQHFNGIPPPHFNNQPPQHLQQLLNLHQSTQQQLQQQQQSHQHNQIQEQQQHPQPPQIVELNQQQQQEQQRFQQHQNQNNYIDQQQQEQNFHEQQKQFEQQKQEQNFQEHQKQLEQQKQEQNFKEHQQQIADQQKQEQKFHPQIIDQQPQEHFQQMQHQLHHQHEEQHNNIFQSQQQQHQQQQQENNFIITTTPPPQTVQSEEQHFRISNRRDIFSHYNKPTTKPPALKIVTAPLLSSSDFIGIGNGGNGGKGFPDPPTPPIFQSFSDNSITRSSPGYNHIDWPKTNSKFDSDYFDSNIHVNTLDNAPSQSQTSTIGTSFKVTGDQSETSDNSRIHSISAMTLGSPTKLVPVRKSKVLSDFRPSPQLHSFEDTTTGLRSYISVPNDRRERERDGKMSSGFQASEARYYPPYESGFRPIPFNHYAFLYGKTGATPKTQMENSIRQHYYSPWISSSTSSPSTLPERTDRKLVHGTLSQLLLASDIVSTESPFLPFKTHYSRKPNLGRQVTTSSSELIEDWISGPHSNRRGAKGSKRKFPIYSGKITKKQKPISPKKCEKFHRFGFCPVTSHYPLENVEKIALRCSALLSHLIAPLPRADVRYDVIVSKNGSLLKERTSRESGGWSWKSFAGKPVCDTKEIKIIPGFAKNEAGEWLVVLQTEIWKQEVQISLCSPQGPNCDGPHCGVNSLKTKCVQRFTAQRVVVLDPENEERCPVVRSVFFPSACVCLTDPNQSESPTHRQSQSYGAEEEIGSNNDSDFESHPVEKRQKNSLEDLDVADSSRYNAQTDGEQEAGLEQDPEASAETETEARVSASNYVPVISVENPVANSTFMIITEKFTTNESTSSTESAESHRVSSTVSTTPNSIEDSYFQPS